MQRTESQPIETLTGEGTLSHNGAPLGQASYHLEVRQDVVVVPSNKGEERLLGKTGVSGTLNLTSGDLGWPPPDQVVLTIKDGRQLAVIFNHISLQARLMVTSSSYSATR